MSSPAPHHESPDSSSTPTFSLLDSWNRRFSNTKSNSEEEHGAQFASVKESEEGGTPTLQSPPGRRISKNYDVRRSLVEVSNNLRRPINYAYFSAVTIHVVLLLFAVICLAVRGDEKGLKTHIHTENLGVFQSGLNAMTGVFGVAITSLLAALAEKAASCPSHLREKESRLDFHVRLNSSLERSFLFDQIDLEALSRSLPGGENDDRAITSVCLFGDPCSADCHVQLRLYLECRDAPVTLLGLSGLPLGNQPNLSGSLWQTYGASSFIAPNNTAPGNLRGRVWDYPPTSSQNSSSGIGSGLSAGTMLVPAVDFKVNCGFVHFRYHAEIDLAQLNSDHNPLLPVSTYPVVVTITPDADSRNQQYPDLVIQYSIPWVDCKKWGQIHYGPRLRTLTLDMAGGATDSYEKFIEYPHMPLTYFAHYTCPRTDGDAEHLFGGIEGSNHLGEYLNQTLYKALPESDTNSTWNESRLLDLDENGYLQDLGINLNVFACSLSASPAGNVEIRVPEGTLTDPDFDSKYMEIKDNSANWKQFVVPDLINDGPNVSAVDKFPYILTPRGAPMFSDISTGSFNEGCLGWLTTTCHVSTAVEAILNDALYQNHTRPNQNDLSNIELTLEKIVGSTFGNLAGILDSSDIQTYSSTYQETVQYAKLNFNKWPLLLGIFGSFVSLVLATVLLRPLPDDAPFVKGTDLLHITRLLAISDIPGNMRDSSASRKELRLIGQGMIVAVDRGGSTLATERAMMTSSMSPLPVLSPSGTGLDIPGLSFREKPATPGLELEEA